MIYLHFLQKMAHFFQKMFYFLCLLPSFFARADFSRNFFFFLNKYINCFTHHSIFPIVQFYILIIKNECSWQNIFWSQVFAPLKPICGSTYHSRAAALVVAHGVCSMEWQWLLAALCGSMPEISSFWKSLQIYTWPKCSTK